MNGGKLPTLTETIKEVGGSHYTIRSIMQEMEYRSKAPQTDRMHEDALLKEVAAVDKSSAYTAAVLTSRPIGKKLSEQVVNPKTTVDGDDMDLVYLNPKSFVAEEESKTSNLSRTSIAKETLTEQVVNPKTTGHGYDVDLDYLNPKSLGAEEESKISITLRTSITEEVINPKKTIDGDDVDLGYSNLESFIAEEECKTSTLSRMSIAEEVVNPKTMVNGDDVDLDYSNFKSLDAEEESKTSISLKTSITEEDDSSSYMETVRHESKTEQPEMDLPLHAESSEHDIREKSPSEGQHPQKQQHEQPYESDKLATNNSEMQGGNELPKETTMWGNLKSIADGIIKIWRGL